MSPNGGLLASGQKGKNSDVIIWNTQTLTQQFRFQFSPGMDYSLIVSAELVTKTDHPFRSGCLEQLSLLYDTMMVSHGTLSPVLNFGGRKSMMS
jgi:hypothetical protein